jgi:hypothetical protein
MEESEDERLMEVSDLEDQDGGDDDQRSTPLTTPNLFNGDDLKRKRAEDGDEEVTPVFDMEGTPSKRVKADTPPPPPPPPPPCEDMSVDDHGNEVDINGQPLNGVTGIDESISRAVSSKQEMDEDTELQNPQQGPLPPIEALTDEELNHHHQINGEGRRHVAIPNGA